MSEQTRYCPTCGHSLLGLTTSEEIASCPNCGRFFARYQSGVSRWPALWKMALMLCGPMVLVALMRAGQWFALRAEQKVLFRVFEEAYTVGVPLAWFGWPLLCGYLLSQKYASGPERWMSWLGLAVAAMVGNTAVMLATMLVRVLV
jgi:ribosomal protein S27AE